MKKIITVMLTLIIGLSIPNFCKAEDNIFINKDKITIEENKTVQLLINIEPEYIKWSSDNESIATVSGTGLVTAVKAGAATIIADVCGDQLICKVTVIKPKSKKNIHLTASQSVVVLPMTDSIEVNLTRYKLSETKIKVTSYKPDIVKCHVRKTSQNCATISFESINPGITDVFVFAEYKDGRREMIKINVIVLDNAETMPSYSYMD